MNKTRFLSLLMGTALLICILLFSSCGNEFPPMEGDLPDLLEDFTEKITGGDFEGAYAFFDRPMRIALPKSRLKRVWTDLVSQAGSFVKARGYVYEQTQGYDVFNVTLEFENAFINMRTVFNSDKRVSGLFFRPGKDPDAPSYTLPSYGEPALYTEEEIRFGLKDWELSGTLTIPDGEGPFPAVILVHGSGPNDRDESVGSCKPFTDIAVGLANKGIMVLRYDKRTYTHGNKFALIKEYTVYEETVEDARLAIDFLKNHPKADPIKIHIIGHSLGGMLAPRIAEGREDVAGCILMAAAARPLEELILLQTRYLAQADGKVTPEEEKAIRELQKQKENIQSPNLSSKSPPSELMGVPASYWLDLRQYSPVETAARLAIPLLVLQGERDYQVTMEDFGLFQEGLGNKKNVTFKSYPSLNHLFIRGDGKSLPEEYERPGNVAEETIQDIADWIKSQ